MHRLCTVTMPHRAYGLCAMVLTQVKAVGLVVVFTTLCGQHQPCCGLWRYTTTDGLVVVFDYFMPTPFIR